jgi:hypothetical protein
VALVLALIAVAACSSDSGSLGEPGEPGWPAAVERQTADSRPGSPVSMTPGLRAAYIAARQTDAPAEYDFGRASAAAPATGDNAAQALSVELVDGALRVQPHANAGAWSCELRWTGIGRGAELAPVEQSAAAPEVTDNRATWRRGDGSEEWYLNGPLGVEQGFVLSERPAGAGEELVVEVTVSGSLVPSLAADGTRVSLRTGAGKPALQYTDLYARDADGTLLEAQMAVEGERILLLVDDHDARYPLSIDPLIWTEVKKLTASDAEAGDNFGHAVAVSGDTAIVGAHQEDTGGSNAGAAYVFYRDWGGVDYWGQWHKLIASDAEAGDQFGRSVAISGDTAIVGAYGEDAGGSAAGAAYVFDRDQGGADSWGEVKKLVASDPEANDQFG